MANCPKCSTEINNGEKFCPSCGSEVASNVDFSGKINEINNTADYTGEYSEKDINDNKTLSLFAYIGILFLIPMLGAKDSKYAKFHVNQGIVLFLTEIVLNIIFGVLCALPVVGFVGSILSVVVGFATLAFTIIGIVNAVTGKAKELPIIGKIRILK